MQESVPCFSDVGAEQRTDPPKLLTSFPSFRTPRPKRYDFAKLETPWRESRERKSPREGSLPDTHSVSAAWFVFPPATFLPR